MKIVILTPADHFHSPVILRAIGQMSDNEIVVVTTPKLGSNSLSRLSKIIKQSGSDYLVSFIMAKICYLVLGAAERLLGKPFQARQFLSVDEVISHFNFRRLNLWNVNGLQDVQLLKELNPDIIITLFFNQMLKEPVLKLARYGNINIHPSFLPAYRGISPCFWALANGESQTGISIHYLTPGIDEGHILWQAKVDISPSDTYFTLYRKCALKAAESLPEALEMMTQGEKGILQDESRATYFTVITAKAVRRFRARGRRFWVV